MFALLVAMSGTGYAVSQLPDNSVGTKQLKKQAVTTKKIAANAVNGARVAGNTLKGGDIKESTLSSVPQAAHADSATTASKADSATTAGKADTATKATKANTAANADALQGHGAGDFVSSSAYKRVVLKMQDGDEREIVRHGPISLYARCATVAGNDTLRIFAKTDVDGAIMRAGWGDTLDGTTAGDFLNTTTSETDREWDNYADRSVVNDDSTSTPTNVTKIVQHYDDSHLIAPTGEAISWEGETELLAFNYLVARCLVAGDIHLWNLGWRRRQPAHPANSEGWAGCVTPTSLTNERALSVRLTGSLSGDRRGAGDRRIGWGWEVNRRLGSLGSAQPTPGRSLASGGGRARCRLASTTGRPER